RPCFTGANAAAAGLFDNGMTDPMSIVPSIGAVAASGSAHASVLTVQPDGSAVVVSGAPVVSAPAVVVSGAPVVSAPAVVVSGAPVVSAPAVVSGGAVVVASPPSSSPPQAPTRRTAVAAKAAQVERRRIMVVSPIMWLLVERHRPTARPMQTSPARPGQA